jgi:hypothetical protein
VDEEKEGKRGRERAKGLGMGNSRQAGYHQLPHRRFNPAAVEALQPGNQPVRFTSEF